MEFFSREQVNQANNTMSGVKGKTCQTCGLYKSVLSPRMKPYGNFKKRILNIGEAPGQIEDQRGKQWQGKVGQILQRTYRKFGIDLFDDCLNINSINCRPPDNRKPSDHEIDCCRSRVLKLIRERNPRVIVLIGGTAVQALLGTIWKSDLGGISKWRGWTIPDRTYNAWICPVFHPSYIARSDQEVETIWHQDLKNALPLWKTPLPEKEDFESQVKILRDNKEILSALESISLGPIGSDSNLLALDYETTGLKPHNTKDHRIVCMSLCDADHRSIVFERPKSKRIQKMIKKVLTDPGIQKTAWNMKFEWTWTKVQEGYSMGPFAFDPMLACHVEDNRPGITGLKIQTYRHFGIAGYDDDVGYYLKAVDNKNGNSVNRIDELIAKPGGLDKLMLYCGLDSLFERRISMKMMKEMGVL